MGGLLQPREVDPSQEAGAGARSPGQGLPLSGAWPSPGGVRAAHCSRTPGGVRGSGVLGVPKPHSQTPSLACRSFAADPLRSPAKPGASCRRAGVFLAKRPALRPVPSRFPTAAPPLAPRAPPERGRLAAGRPSAGSRLREAPVPQAAPAPRFPSTCGRRGRLQRPHRRAANFVPPAQQRSSQSLRGRAHSLPAPGTRPPAPLGRRGRGEQRAARDAPGSRRRRRRPRPSAAARSLRLPGRGEGSRSPGAGAGAGTSPTCGGAGPLPAAREGSARPLGARAPAGSGRQLMETFPGGAPGERAERAGVPRRRGRQPSPHRRDVGERARGSHPAAH